MKKKTNKANCKRKRAWSLWLTLVFLCCVVTYIDNLTVRVVVAARTYHKRENNSGKNQSEGNDDWRNWNYYQILGLEEPGDDGLTDKKKKRKNRALLSKSQIKTAYRKQAQLWHPDKVLQRQKEQGSESKEEPAISVKEATDRFAAISQAYETLLDEKLKAEYDKIIAAGADKQQSSQNQYYESSYYANSNTFHNYDDTLLENQVLDVYSSPLQSPNGIFVAYLTPQCEFVIRRLHGYYYYEYNDGSSNIWKTTKDAFYNEYGYSFYSTDRCFVKLSGPKLFVLFDRGFNPLIVWQSTTPTLDDDDEEDNYFDSGRRRKKKSSDIYYMKLTDEGVLVIYRRKAKHRRQKNNAKINLVRGFHKIIRQTADAVKSSLFSKMRTANSSNSRSTESEDDQVEDECMWSSDGIAGRGGCTVYAVRRNVVELQSRIINSLSIAWFGAVQKIENILREDWIDIDHLLNMANVAGRWGRKWLSKSYLNVKQAIRQQHEHARERIDLH
jgi:curved DNA-binding protein CbpA